MFKINSVKIVLIFLIGSSLLSLSCKEKPTEPPDDDDGTVEPPYKGKIVFSSKMGGESQNIYTINPDGTNLKQLTFGSYNSYSPTWSPDKKQIVFVSDSLGTTAGSPLFVMNGDGTNIRPLKWEDGNASPLFGNLPSWSPDGKRIAFSYCNCEASSNSEIFVIKMETKEVKQLTHNSAYDSGPDWSPDGSKIVFVSDRSFNAESRTGAFTELYIMDSSGFNEERITFSGALISNYSPRWSPTKNLILYVSYLPSTQTSNIFLYSIASYEVLQLTNYKATGSGAWSPNGEFLIVPREAEVDSAGPAILNLEGKVIYTLSLYMYMYKPDWK